MREGEQRKEEKRLWEGEKGDNGKKRIRGKGKKGGWVGESGVVRWQHRSGHRLNRDLNRKHFPFSILQIPSQEEN